MDSNVTLIKLQKQLADRSATVTEMEARFLQLQEVRSGYPPGLASASTPPQVERITQRWRLCLLWCWTASLGVFRD